MSLVLDGTAGVTFPNSTVQAISGTQGVTDASNAAAGIVGEYQTATSGLGSAMTSGVAVNATSISLTAGDWDVSGTVNYGTSATSITSFSMLNASVNTVSASVNTVNTQYIVPGNSAAFSDASAGTINLNSPVTRISIAATTTVYLVGYAFFVAGGGNLKCGGTIRARRVR